MAEFKVINLNFKAIFNFLNLYFNFYLLKYNHIFGLNICVNNA